MYKKSMFKLIIDKGVPPTRIMRYCCSELKERGGKGEVCLFGIRWAESIRRKNTRNSIEFNKEYKINDNDEARRHIENCTMRGKIIINPIIDWSDEDVWNFIKNYNLKYCKLYNKGFKRIGCIGCPMSNKHRKTEFERYPKFKEYYIKAFEKMIEQRIELNKPCTWKTGQEVFDWWLSK